MMLVMRTTLTLDEDLAARLRAEAARQGLPFEQVVNRVIRLGLRTSAPTGERARFETLPRGLGLRPGIHPGRLNQLADELETEALASSQRLSSQAPGTPDSV